jgi:hypothetical protein
MTYSNNTLTDPKSQPLVVNGEKGEENDVSSLSKNDEGIESLTQDASKYPHGTTLFFIIVALILSIFLASLDMVRRPCLSFLIELETDNDFTRPLSQQRFLGSLMNFTASTRYHGTVQPFS